MRNFQFSGRGKIKPIKPNFYRGEMNALIFGPEACPERSRRVYFRGLLLISAVQSLSVSCGGWPMATESAPVISVNVPICSGPPRHTINLAATKHSVAALSIIVCSPWLARNDRRWYFSTKTLQKTQYCFCLLFRFKALYLIASIFGAGLF